MKLYIVRHGQTDWNVLKRLQGGSDIDLNDTGRTEAAEAAWYFKGLGVKYCFASPLKRARHTAEILLEGCGVEVVTDERLREMSFGVNEGKYPNERTPGTELCFTSPCDYVPAKGAESYESIIARTKEFIDDVLVPLSVNDPDATVLLVGHGALNRALMLTLSHRKLADIWAGAYTRNLYVCQYEIAGHDYRMVEDFHSVNEDNATGSGLPV